ncbi:protein phosphatase CheZ [Methylobrevis pamukkalensis]|uniref:Chemotaxis phosphatase, CheZ n=1 Tax=Methylobrevis pamukkalensis TaxID=1439726 RepID=A0A1E3H5X1_9HYPH|nr:protein phosphatase CheZ [Methylobrevis pamukkalensis]ODN71713.1 Chemotaxis phosphatase, CheZ [Methylobrevis pamukkalensis]
MSRGKRAYRIESYLNGASAQLALPSPAFDQSAQILHEISELKRMMAPTREVSTAVLEDYRRQFGEAMKLKDELDEIQAAIMQTKREIATLHVSNFEGREMSRVTDELDAVVHGTERATETILSAAEVIDDAANTLAARTKGEDHALAADIQERVIAIFEACNFQDLTGQRINKVVHAMRFIETRVARMIEIWGGMEASPRSRPTRWPSARATPPCSTVRRSRPTRTSPARTTSTPCSPEAFTASFRPHLPDTAPIASARRSCYEQRVNNRRGWR